MGETKVYQAPGSPAPGSPSSSRLTWNIVVNLDNNTVKSVPTRGRSSVVVIEGNKEFIWDKLDKSRKVSREDNFVVFRDLKSGRKELKRVEIPEMCVLTSGLGAERS